jgi:hypothetical protein
VIACLICHSFVLVSGIGACAFEGDISGARCAGIEVAFRGAAVRCYMNERWVQQKGAGAGGARVRVEGNRKSVEENVSICKKVENDNGERERNRKVDEKKRWQKCHENLGIHEHELKSDKILSSRHGSPIYVRSGIWM